MRHPSSETLQALDFQDGIYIRTEQGWLYLAAVVDLYSRKVVGWSMKATLNRKHRARCVAGCSLVAQASSRGLGPFRSGQPRRIQTFLPSPGSGAQHESQRQLLGQCRHGVVLQQPDEGTHSQADLQDPGHGPGRCV